MIAELGTGSACASAKSPWAASSKSSVGFITSPSSLDLSASSLLDVSDSLLLEVSDSLLWLEVSESSVLDVLLKETSGVFRRTQGRFLTEQ